MERKFALVYFDSTTKTVIGPKDSLDKSFQEIFNRIDKWISEGPGSVIESTDREYVNVSIYSPLSLSSYIELPDRLRNSKTDLISIKNNDSKCFLWCHVKHLNPLEIYQERLTKRIE